MYSIYNCNPKFLWIIITLIGSFKYSSSKLDVNKVVSLIDYSQAFLHQKLNVNKVLSIIDYSQAFLRRQSSIWASLDIHHS